MEILVGDCRSKPHSLWLYSLRISNIHFFLLGLVLFYFLPLLLLNHFQQTLTLSQTLIINYRTNGLDQINGGSYWHPIQPMRVHIEISYIARYIIVCMNYSILLRLPEVKQKFSPFIYDIEKFPHTRQMEVELSAGLFQGCTRQLINYWHCPAYYVNWV